MCEYNKYFQFFQKTCIQIKEKDNNKETNVFKVIPSLKNIPTNRAYTTIPTPNPINRAGHNIPKDSTVNLVPQI